MRDAIRYTLYARAMSEQKPTVGRIVHYVPLHTYGPCRAAIVTDVSPDRIDLAVFNPTILTFEQGVMMGDFTENQGGTWHWPERA